MKLLSAYETDVARIYVIELRAAVPSGLNIASSPAVTETIQWGLDVPEGDSYRETQLIYQQRDLAAAPTKLRRRITQREGREL